MAATARLLLVEDEAGLRGLVAQFLQSAGYVVTEACDGPDGVALYQAAGPFDLVMVDLNLPGFSGVEVSRRIRQLTPEQPILVCSAAVSPDAERALRALGVLSYLTKPYHPEALLLQVSRLLNPPLPAPWNCRSA